MGHVAVCKDPCYVISHWCNILLVIVIDTPQTHKQEDNRETDTDAQKSVRDKAATFPNLWNDHDTMHKIVHCIHLRKKKQL